MVDTSSLSRREVITGCLRADSPPEAHVSSLVVHSRHERLDQVRAVLRGMPGVEIHAEAAGKMIVTLETASEHDIVEKLNAISLLEGVLSAALVFHHVESTEAQG